MENMKNAVHDEMLKGKSGDDFDKAFLEHMRMHHEQGVEMAKAAMENAKHDEIKDMAKKMISDQTEEMKEMSRMEREWYR